MILTRTPVRVSVPCILWAWEEAVMRKRASLLHGRFFMPLQHTRSIIVKTLFMFRKLSFNCKMNHKSLIFSSKFIFFYFILILLINSNYFWLSYVWFSTRFASIGSLGFHLSYFIYTMGKYTQHQWFLFIIN